MRRTLPLLVIVTVAAFVVIALAATLCYSAEPPPQQQRELWLYYPTNLLPDENVSKLEPIWARAARAGYTHVMLADSKFSRLGALGDSLPRYLKNVERTK